MPCLVLLLLAACDDRQQDPSDLENADELLAADDSTRSSHYACDNGLNIEARYEPRHNQMVIFMIDRAVRLEHVESASGAKFGAGDIVFWTKGDSALLTRSGEPDRQCHKTSAAAD